MKTLCDVFFRKATPYAAPALVALALGGCRTTEKVLRDYEAAISTGRYEAAVPEVTKLAEKGDDSQQLWRLLAAAANHMAGNDDEAIRQFDAAEEVFRKNDTTSVFAQALDGTFAMMTNDRAFPYDGGGQDRVFTCVYRAIDFMCAGDTGNALVEFNRAMQYQANWRYARRKEIAASASRMEKDADAYQKQKGQANATTTQSRAKQTRMVLGNPGFAAQLKEECGFDPARPVNIELLPESDFMNVYATHLTGVFRWLNGESDRNDLRQAYKLAPFNAVVKRDWSEFSRDIRPREQVWVYVEDGLCPCREEWRVDLPLAVLPAVGDYVMYAGMAFPKLRARAYGAVNWSVQAGGTGVVMSQLANVDALVKTEYDVYMRGALAREITRTLVKIGLQVALGTTAEVARRRRGSTSGDYLALKLAQVGVATWAATTTAADLRSWTALPKVVMVARVSRPADGRVVVVADGSAIEIALPAGNSIVFVRKPGPSARPVVKTATFR